MASRSEQLSRVLSLLPGNRQSGGEFHAKCPAHDDRQASLCLSDGDKGVVIYCHAGCTLDAVCGAIGVKQSELFYENGNGHKPEKKSIAAVYPYRDESGNLLFEKVRFHPKEFRQRRPDGSGGYTWNLNGVRKVLYRLPELLAADRESFVFVVEGEKDVDNLRKHGLIATTNPDGAGKSGDKWRHVDDSPLEGRHVVIIPDDDEAGTNHAKSIFNALKDKAASVRVLWLPGEGKDTTDWLDAGGDSEQLITLAEQAKEETEKPTHALFHFHTAAEFDALDLRRDYYIPDVLAAGPVPTIVAGSFKSLKTSVAMDLFISLATGTPFLGHFRIAKDARVGVMSGESGGFALQDLARRVCRSKGRDMVSIGDWFNICTTVPTLSDQQHMETIERIIEERKLDIVAIDPTYLAMRGMRTEDAGNLFSMGKFLEPLSRMAERTGCTPVIIHHNSRGATRANVNEPAELADIAWSGFAEWAGQWVLLSRRERYDPDSNGEHRLWLNAGGRDGHSTLVGVDVTEGKQTDKGGRRWDVAVEGARDARKQLAELQEERKSYQKEAAIERDRELIIKVMGKVPDGDTKTGIKDRCGMNSGRFDKAFAALMQEDLILSCEIKKGNGAMYPGFSLNTIKASAPKKKEPGLIA